MRRSHQRHVRPHRDQLFYNVWYICLDDGFIVANSSGESTLRTPPRIPHGIRGTAADEWRITWHMNPDDAINTHFTAAVHFMCHQSNIWPLQRSIHVYRRCSRTGKGFSKTISSAGIRKHPGAGRGGRDHSPTEPSASKSLPRVDGITPQIYP